MDFYSDHTIVAVIIPVGERLGPSSFGILEREDLDAIQARALRDR
jgi:hypothetical protein